MNLTLMGCLAALLAGTLIPMSWAALISAVFLSCVFVLALANAPDVGHLRHYVRFSLPAASIALCLMWSSAFTGTQLDHRLSPLLHGQDVALKGCVVGDVDRQAYSSLRSRARFKLVLDPNALSKKGLRNVRVSWFNAPDWLSPGVCLTGVARLKPPRSYANGLSYDYVASMLFQKIDATGYLTQGAQVTPPEHGFLRADALANQVKQAALTGLSKEAIPWVKGLVFGDKTAFDSAQWRLVRDTGTLHLLVVSGLHVSMIGAMGLLAGAIVARLLMLLATALPWATFAAGVRVVQVLPVISALAITAAYVALAGSGISLIRAWFMFAAALAIWKLPKRIRRLPLLLLAALAIMVMNPLSWTQAGFWYSFWAVAALVFFFEGRRTSRISVLLAPQILILFAMLPVMFYFGQAVTPVHLIANFFAIPLVTLVILPLALLSAISPFEWVGPVLSFFNGLFWSLLEGLPELPKVDLFDSSALVLLAASIAVWIWAGRSWALPGSFTAIYLSISFLPGISPTQAPGLWVIDSGQGQAVLISDGKASALIDTGPAFSDSFSVASAAILPVMRQKGIHHLDLLVISHSDNDHSGGTSDILKSVTVDRLYVGQPLKLNSRKEQLSCHPWIGSRPQGSKAGSKADSGASVVVGSDLEIDFIRVSDDVMVNDNNQSCVVRVRWAGYSILIPGDADAKVERALIASGTDQLKSDVLVAGHHGSNSSTSSMWLKAVAPQVVVFSAGYRNRFNHPHPDVINRVEREGIPYANTATSGLIEISPDGEVTLMRARWMPHWHAKPDAERDFSLHGHVLE